MTVRATGLTWDVYVAPAEPTVTDDLSAGETQRQWSPASATLISGKREPCSSTPLLTTGPARGLADWVAAHDRNLTAVYITHGHGDHRFGLSIILDRFPSVRPARGHRADAPGIGARSAQGRATRTGGGSVTVVIHRVSACKVIARTG